MTIKTNKDLNMAEENERSDDAPFKLVYSPKNYYTPINSDNQGKWAELSNSKGKIGVLWRDEDNGFGFLGELEEGQSTEDLDKITSLVAAANAIKIPAKQAYGAVISTFNDEEDSTVIYNEGQLSELVGGSTALTAAATAPNYIENSPFTITVDEDGKVLGLAWIDEGVEKLRSNGDWEELENTNDPRFYDNEFHYVSAKAVEIYDKLVEANTPQTLDDYEEVLVD